MVNHRPKWKLPFIHTRLFKLKERSNWITKLRCSIISIKFIYSTIKVYNGIWFLSNPIIHNKVGFKLGQFSLTRRCDPLIHSKVKRGRKKKNVSKKN